MDSLLYFVCLLVGVALPVGFLWLIGRRAWRQLQVAEAYRIVARSLGLLVDTRGVSVHGHIDGATHIPMGEIPARLDDLPEGDPLIVTCRVGGRSARVAAWLNANGFDAVNMAGGMGEWEAAGRPMVSETGQPTR